MEPDRAEAARGFARDLRQLHLRAGKPSYATLERLSNHRLRRATMSDILNGNRANLPDWRFVRLFVEAGHAAARETGWTRMDWAASPTGRVTGTAPLSGSLTLAFPAGPARFRRRRSRGGPGRAGGGGHRSRLEDSRQGRRLPAVWGAVPPRLTDFVGRESWLGYLGQVLDAESRVGPVVILGLCGTGKTQLAAEYAYRHAGAYDLVWWIPCDDGKSIPEAMADLRSRLELPDATEEDEGYADVLDILRRGERYARWLLIFDGADEPDEVRHLVPPLGAMYSSHRAIAAGRRPEAC